jgi:hypothetical protein
VAVSAAGQVRAGDDDVGGWPAIHGGHELVHDRLAPREVDLRRHDHIPARGHDARVQRMTPSAISRIAEHPHPRVLVRDGLGNLRRIVRRAVVHDDQLPRRAQRPELHQHLPDGVLDDAALVVERADDRDLDSIG